MSTEQDLFDRVVADLDDDAPRAVLADHWLERGSKRGEVVLQQLAGKDVRALVKKHEAEWLGDLATVTKYRFWQRGFLYEIELAAESAADDVVWDRALASRELQTLSAIHKGKAHAERYGQFVEAARGLRKLTALTKALAKTWASRREPWAITQLDLPFAAEAKTAKLVAASSAFPRLREVSLGISEDLVAAAQALEPLGLARIGALPRSGQRFTPKIVELLMAPVANERWLDTSNGSHIVARTRDRVLELVITSADLYAANDVVQTLRESGIRVAVSLRLPPGQTEPHPLLDCRVLDAIRGYTIDADAGWAMVL